MTRKEPEELPAAAQVTAHTHIAMLQAALPGLSDSYYVTGSAALGDFIAGKSDLDFVVLLRRRLEIPEVEKLKALHRRLADKSLFTGLDGFYLTPGDLKDGGGAGCLRFNGGRYQGLKPFGLHTPDAWVLKRYGICLLGGQPVGLPFEPDWSFIRRGMLENLDVYWRGWAQKCRLPTIWALALYARPAAVEWGVLGISRLYYSLRENDVTSKTGAGEYALQRLPEKRRRVLREALRIRGGEYEPQYRSAMKRRNDALEYVEFMMEECSLTPLPPLP